MPAFAEEAVVAVAPPVVNEFPTDWGLTADYYTDAAKVVRHMRVASPPRAEIQIIRKELRLSGLRAIESSHNLHG